jgi:histidinol-phosphatase (PHP family)
MPYLNDATGNRMDYREKKAYLTTISKLKVKYQNQIVVLRGFETEYQADLAPELKSMFINRQIDYLVLGQHFHSVYDIYTYYPLNRDSRMIKAYVDRCIAAFASGLFLFIAHPSLPFMNIRHFDEVCVRESKRLIQAAIDYHVYLEYNAGGVRKSLAKKLTRENYRYPHHDFWQIVKELQAPTIINADAHAPAQISDQAYWQAHLDAQEIGLNVIRNLDYQRYFKQIAKIVGEA